MININGPVPINSVNYIERKFEISTRSALLKRDWVLMLGPRQHGKTSALIRINKYLNDSGFRSGIVDLQRLPPALNFNQLLSWFCKSIANSMGLEFSEPTEGSELIDWLKSTIPTSGAPVVILVDEASSIRDEAQRNAFYGQIRSIKGAAAVSHTDSLEANLQFVFSGTFRPETLVDDLNSPFNVCIRVDTEDLNRDQVNRLVSLCLSKPESEIMIAADRIYSAVGGQPHLVQSLTGVIEGNSGEDDLGEIDKTLLHWQFEGSEHIRSVFYLVLQDSNLSKITAVVANQGKIVNDPANIDYKFLTTAGLLCRDGANLIFRNKLYEKIAQSSTQLIPDQPTAVNASGFLLPLRDADFSFVTDPELREIGLSSYNGAIEASNKRNFRLAIVGYGVALEAILVDWILQQNSSTIATAIANAASSKKPNFSNFEDKNDPLTWKLVNLMKVGRLLNGVRGPVELPDALREYRNWVHPAVIKKIYRTEESVEPEARSCNALLSIIIRDIQ